MSNVAPANHAPTGKPGAESLAATGIPGLDYVLRGGLPRRRLYLVQGSPGVGKTTLALQFLLEGVRNKERVLYVTLSETLDEINEVAASHRWSLEGIDVFEMSAGEQVASAQKGNTLFHPAEFELTEVMKRLYSLLESVKPSRVVFDSLSEVRLMAGDPLRYRREILSLKSELAKRNATVLLLDDLTLTDQDQHLQSLAHGVISLAREAPQYGAARRRLEVTKLRGVPFRDGLHDVKIVSGGMQVFPRLVAGEYRHPVGTSLISSGNDQLDVLLGGGIDRASSVLLLGPAGIGKSTVALTFAVAAAERGEKVALYSFDESLMTLHARARSMGIDLKGWADKGLITLRKVDPAEMTPGQFASMLVSAVDKDGVSMVVIDGLNGYMNAMPREDHLTLHLHELLSVLNSLQVTVFLVVAQHGMVGAGMVQPIDVSYLADTVILFRYYEFGGEIRQAVSIFKRRGGAHERTIRELRLGPPRGVSVGEPLHAFRGVLTGVPTYHGDGKEGRPA